ERDRLLPARQLRIGVTRCARRRGRRRPLYDVSSAAQQIVELAVERRLLLQDHALAPGERRLLVVDLRLRTGRSATTLIDQGRPLFGQLPALALEGAALREQILLRRFELALGRRHLAELVVSLRRARACR